MRGTIPTLTMLPVIASESEAIPIRVTHCDGD